VTVRGAYCPEKSAKLKGELIGMQYKIMNDPDFEPSALAILLAIAIPIKNGAQCSWQSFDTIAKITGLSKTTVIRVVQMLVAKGIVMTRGGRAGSGHATHYRFNVPGSSWGDDDAIPAKAIGTLTDLLSRNSAPKNGTLTDLNHKGRRSKGKEEQKERSEGPSLISIDRVPTTPREEITTNNTSDASPLSPEQSITCEIPLSAPHGAENHDDERRIQCNDPASLTKLSAASNAANTAARDGEAVDDECDVPRSSADADCRAPEAPPSDYFRPEVSTQRAVDKTHPGPDRTPAIATPSYDESEFEFLLYPDSSIVRKTACHGAIFGFVMGHDLRRLFVSR